MKWTKLTNVAQLEDLDRDSAGGAALLYKHSDRCGICATALDRLERKWKDEETGKIKPYFIDVLNNRDVSDAVAAKYGVKHESPQVLLIRDGKCVHHRSHMGIQYQELVDLAG